MNEKHDRAFTRGLVSNIRNKQLGELARRIKASMDHPDCPVDLMLDLEKSKLATWISKRLNHRFLEDNERER